MFGGSESIASEPLSASILYGSRFQLLLTHSLKQKRGAGYPAPLFTD
jgi:hypothetical protein